MRGSNRYSVARPKSHVEIKQYLSNHGFASLHVGFALMELHWQLATGGYTQDTTLATHLSLKLIAGVGLNALHSFETSAV